MGPRIPSALLQPLRQQRSPIALSSRPSSLLRHSPHAPSSSSQYQCQFSTALRLCEEVQPVVVPVRKPVGAFRGSLFGFLFGSSLSGAAVYYYILQEYKVSNELLTEDIYVSTVSPGGMRDQAGKDLMGGAGI